MRHLVLLIALSGCTDAAWDAKIGKLGDPARVTCYSAEKVIYDGKSTGAVRNPEGSDGYQFRESGSNRFVEVSGNCVIDYGK